MKKEDFRTKSYWLSSREYAPGRSLSGDIKVDVAIVGGGFTGLSTALHLKKTESNLRVAILESQVIGFGASGRNGGFNMTLFGLTMGLTALRFGRSKAREAHLYMEQAVDLLKDLVAERSIDCDYEHPGFLRAATSQAYKKRIMHEVELAHSLGLEGIEWIDRDAVREQVNSPMYLGAWSEPRCGILNPAKLAWGEKDVVESLGVEVYENTPVLGLERTAGGAVLKTQNGSVSADKVVLATNAWSHLVPQIQWKQAPVWTYIVLTEPLSREQMEPIGWKNRQGIEDARNMVHYYRLTADNRLLMGGRDIGLTYGADMDNDLNPGIFAGLEADVKETFPSLEKVNFTHRWGGPVSITVDMAPAIGYVGDQRIVYSLGCMGHGVSLTHLNGATAADLILEKRTDLTDFFFVNRRTIPWPPEPIRLAAAKAILAGMKFQDRITDQKRL
ncbi:FAD dependent oxidoreductase [Desulfatibacillum aliphaticivorans]|uniref:FAD dependent oxidoreductase n=1 Tax=Desulfatibacillum aliphaticivorans TaxID=218208 RepID=B8FK07_DESAL|nr:FAD-dependent oxidoreductase [Desulfatibacillum aliphaticivorans]ACL02435.1 FAD dependent oxidoreductase [Desulfatibacillum aliphaticivorans]